MNTAALIYGATGYTGALIARLAVARGLQPILAGRNASKLAPLAANLGLSYRAFRLDQASEIDSALEGVSVLLNCASPFAETAQPLVHACLRRRAHYLDLAHAAPDFEALLPLDMAARAAGILLLPGAGYAVAPSDCLSAQLKARLPGATQLTLAFQEPEHMPLSALDTLHDLAHNGLARSNGALLPARPAAKKRAIDFGSGPMPTFSNPWRGDLSSAFVTTNIPNIETYSRFPSTRYWLISASRLLRGLPGASLMRKLRRLAPPPARPANPGAAEGCVIWGEAIEPSGQIVRARLHTPNPYTTAALTSLAILAQVLSGTAPTGFQTPARAYGADFILNIPGVTQTVLTGS